MNAAASAGVAPVFIVPIFIVIVLYNQQPSESAAVTALTRILNAESALADRFRILLYDNSPQPHTEVTRFEYLHDAANAGLAKAYNYALEQATAAGSAWLLLLDQDTELTPAYLHEALELSSTLLPDPRVAAIVPKLQSAKGIKSPTLDFLEWLRRQLQFPRRRALFATTELYGFQQQEWTAFNSASLLRVAHLHAIGGFPIEFPLDFLDTAVFRALHAAGWNIWVMHSTLQHELSMDTKAFYERRTGIDRHRSLLFAMTRFVNRHGVARDRWLTRLWLLRNAVNLSTSARDKRFALASLRQAIQLRDR